MLKIFAATLALMAFSSAQAEGTKLTETAKYNLKTQFAKHRTKVVCDRNLVDYKALSAELTGENINLGNHALAIYSHIGGGGERDWTDKLEGTLLTRASVGEKVHYFTKSGSSYLESDKTQYDHSDEDSRKLEVAEDIRKVAYRVSGEVSCDYSQKHVDVRLEFYEGASEVVSDVLEFKIN